MELRGSKTEQNIEAAFAGECQARARYLFYAKHAHDEGLMAIEALFLKMVENEREHSRIWFDLLDGPMGSTEENLAIAATKENLEWKSTYPRFAETAREEGFEEAALLFERIASIEFAHERQFTEALLRLKEGDAGKLASPGESKEYTCFFCGFTTSTPLNYCPVCGGAQAFSL